MAKLYQIYFVFFFKNFIPSNAEIDKIIEKLSDTFDGPKFVINSITGNLPKDLNYLVMRSNDNIHELSISRSKLTVNISIPEPLEVYNIESKLWDDYFGNIQFISDTLDEYVNEEVRYGCILKSVLNFDHVKLRELTNMAENDIFKYPTNSRENITMMFNSYYAESDSVNYFHKYSFIAGIRDIQGYDDAVKSEIDINNKKGSSDVNFKGFYNYLHSKYADHIHCLESELANKSENV